MQDIEASNIDASHRPIDASHIDASNIDVVILT